MKAVAPRVPAHSFRPQSRHNPKTARSIHAEWIAHSRPWCVRVRHISSGDFASRVPVRGSHALFQPSSTARFGLSVRKGTVGTGLSGRSIMPRDLKVGFALGVLLVGVVGALFFRRDPLPPRPLPRCKPPRKSTSKSPSSPKGLICSARRVCRRRHGRGRSAP